MFGGVFDSLEPPSKPKSTMSQRNILVVDDSSTIRSAVKVSLGKFSGVELRFAVDGFEAMRQIGERLPDLVLADVLMPRISGYQLAAVLKGSPATSSIPLYLLTSKDGEVDKAMGRVRGIDGYLVKPFQKEQMQDLVRRVLCLEGEALAA